MFKQRGKKYIEKKEARKAWESSKAHLLLRNLFGTFEAYWKAIEIFNQLPEDDKHKKMSEAVRHIKVLKAQSTLKKAGLILPDNN